MSDAKRALVILAEGAEEMETTICVDVLRRAGVDVVLAGLDGGDPVLCSRGVRICPDQPLAEVDTDEFDVLILPGGAGGAQRLAESEHVGRLLRQREEKDLLTAAICAAPTALVRHGTHRGRRATCHPSVATIVEAHAKHTGERVEEDGSLITSQGPGTTFEFALALVRRLCGPKKEAEVRGPMLCR